MSHLGRTIPRAHSHPQAASASLSPLEPVQIGFPGPRRLPAAHSTATDDEGVILTPHGQAAASPPRAPSPRALPIQFLGTHRPFKKKSASFLGREGCGECVDSVPAGSRDPSAEKMTLGQLCGRDPHALLRVASTGPRCDDQDTAQQTEKTTSGHLERREPRMRSGCLGHAWTARRRPKEPRGFSDCRSARCNSVVPAECDGHLTGLHRVPARDPESRSSGPR